jgi:plastocyanin
MPSSVVAHVRAALRSRFSWALIAAGLGAALAVLPTLSARAAEPASASFIAVDFAWQANGGSGNQATIAPGGTVTFAYPAGNSMHNVSFGSGPQPSSCMLNGAPTTAPLPSVPTGPGWSGSCTFDTPGTYTFHCVMHPFMTATIVVTDGTSSTTTATTGTAPNPTTTTTGGMTPTGTTTTTYPVGPGSTTTTSMGMTNPTSPTSPAHGSKPGRSPLSGGAAHAIVFPGRQTGSSVRGTVDLASVGAQVQVAVSVPGSELQRGAGARLVAVGRYAQRAKKSGRLRIAISLNRTAAASLRRTHRLALTVRVTVRSTGSTPVMATRHVVLTRPGA